MNTMDAISAAAPPQANEASKSLVQTNDEEVNKPSIRTPKDLWTWFANDPCTRWPLLLFLAGIGFGAVYCILASDNVKKAYLPAGIGALVVCFFGAYHFRELMALKEQVDKYENLNKEFAIENAKISRQVTKLEVATRELTGSKQSLNETNERNKQNLEKFGKLQNNLSLMGEQSGSGMSKIADLAKEMKNKWEKELIRNQRAIFTAVFDEMEFRENAEGMTKQEYEQFLKALPPAYASHIEKKQTFNSLAGDDGVVDIEEFSKLLDQMQDESINLSDVVIEENKNDNGDLYDNDINETKVDNQNQNI